MVSSSPSKKRKRDVEDDDKVSLRLSAQSLSLLGPVLASFPALKPPESTPFACYLLKNKHEKQCDLDGLHIVGEVDTVEFFTSNETQKASMGGCQYLIGVHNKNTKMVTLRPASLHLLTRRVKALKGHEPEEMSALQWSEANAGLRETFGTKKSKAALRAQQRNKVDVSAMESVAEHLQERIESNTGMLPTRDEAREEADSNRLIPPHNSSAEDPADVYPLHGIIPEAEWKALSISALTHAKDDREVRALLPYRRSNWVNQHLTTTLAADMPRKRNLKILYYISVMFAFRWVLKGEIERTQLQEKLGGVSSVIIDGLLARFTETSRGSTKPQATAQTQISLVTHLFALCLRVDDYATDPIVLSADLSLPVTRTHQLFKSLGK